jgi:hypothetical protein
VFEDKAGIYESPFVGLEGTDMFGVLPFTSSGDCVFEFIALSNPLVFLNGEALSSIIDCSLTGTSFIE